MPDGKVHVLHVRTLNVINGQTTSKRPFRASTKPTVSEVLRLLDQLDAHSKRLVVLDFMEEQFGTRLVKALDDRSLKRTHAYARTVLANCAGEGIATHE